MREGRGAGRGKEKQSERGRKKNRGTEGKCRRDKHASSLRSKEVVNGEQAMSGLWPSLKGLYVDMLFSVRTSLEEQQGKTY